MIKSICKLLIIYFLLLGNLSFAKSHWQKINDGLEYQDLHYNFLNPWSHIHVLRINLHTYHFLLAKASEMNKTYAHVSDYAKYYNLNIALNGGFFDQNYHSLGLRISTKQQKNNLKNISWWAIFYIKDDKAYITPVKTFTQDPNIEFAIQAGPRLIVNNTLIPLKSRLAERTALGITKNNEIIILVTENSALSTQELAILMQNPPLNCKDALNLDGGSSSQLYVQSNNLYINAAGLAGVSDAILLQ